MFGRQSFEEADKRRSEAALIDAKGLIEAGIRLGAKDKAAEVLLKVEEIGKENSSLSLSEIIKRVRDIYGIKQ